MQIVLAGVHYNATQHIKKQLEQYTDDMRTALDNPDVAEDVEQRIVDILEEQKVLGGGTITNKEVDIIMNLMGNPADFSDTDMQQMVIYHKKASALQIALRFVSVGAFFMAFTVLILIASAITSYFSRSASETFPTGIAQWLYAITGLSVAILFVIFSVLTGISLLQGKLTKKNRRLLKLTSITGLITIIALALSAWLVIISR